MIPKFWNLQRKRESKQSVFHDTLPVKTSASGTQYVPGSALLIPREELLKLTKEKIIKSRKQKT
jgi:hypothetical protein